MNLIERLVVLIYDLSGRRRQQQRARLLRTARKVRRNEWARQRAMEQIERTQALVGAQRR